jgi:hypothetical protein
VSFLSAINLIGIKSALQGLNSSVALLLLDAEPDILSLQRYSKRWFKALE